MQYQIGEIVDGIITGIKPYGAFVLLDDQTTGLIHISEISDGYVKEISKFVKVNDRIKVKIIDYDKSSNQARLSLKAIQSGRYRKERKNGRHSAKLPKMTIGFKSISSKMDQWIQEAIKEKRND
ncbi:MAG: CvfD/Ygs/GSP13 family RNA-binding post-transcriptional regulator [Anaerorhabdus sp.]